LVVDDQDEVREVTAEILKMGGYTILAAEGGEAAVKKAREYEGVIDLLVSDMVMPEMDGRVVASRLRAGRPALKALYMSGYTENVSLKADALEKWESYIGKPFGVKEMTDKVREVLDGAVASPVVVS
jgi:CheY-like chemotaxis protein